MFTPFNILGIWLRGVLALLFLVGGVTLLTLWYQNREHVVTVPANSVETKSDSNPGRGAAQVRHVSWEFGFNWETAFLLGGLALCGWALGGGWVLSPLLFRKSEKDGPKADSSGTAQRILHPDGTALNVRLYGSENGEPVVFIHGWGLDHNAWYYARKEFSDRYRLIVWDLPGLGGSSPPHNRDWSLGKMARDLDSVLSLTGGKPAVLIGHSIGGMIALTWCKLFPQSLCSRVRGLVIVHSTYTNPIKTCSMPGLMTALQKPVLEPLCHLMVWLSPLVRVMNCLSYLNGSTHWSAERDGFSGNETRQQLEFMARYSCLAPPNVIGRGMLAMLNYDATTILPRITVPTLIVAGDGDTTCTPEASEHMAGWITGARYIVLPNAKHSGFFEKHQEFHAALTRFLSDTVVEREHAFQSELSTQPSA